MLSRNKLLLLFQVRSTTVGGTKMIEVDFSASCLNSNDAFLLMNDRQGYIWVGKGANPTEIKTAYAGAGRLRPANNRLRCLCHNNFFLLFAEKLEAKEKIIELQEENETEDFWKILGGKKGYASSLRLQNSLEDNPPKLFAISNARGVIELYVSKKKIIERSHTFS